MANIDDHSYQEKFARIAAQTSFRLLPGAQQAFLQQQAGRLRFTLQELRQLTEMALDLSMWNESGLQDLWPAEMAQVETTQPDAKKRLLAQVQKQWEALRASPNHYPADFPKPPANKLNIVHAPTPHLGLGRCPVASEKTRCCNLLTLDAAESCGFDCSYCSIQSFYNDDQIRFDPDFEDKLRALTIDPERIYHIGTGQSSDSLMWGNQGGVLDALVNFAERHPNVILELKTKSKNIAYLLKNDIPANIICTWSLNTPTIINHEEHLTASLEERLTAAQRVAAKGLLIGFHLHPMVHYEGWQEDYAKVCRRILADFDPAQVALVSLGTLTFTPRVIKQIRRRDFKSQILRMPMADADGKLSYPEPVKLALFSHAYAQLRAWHDQVFFYLCMENQRLWQPLFGYDYVSNIEFEQVMKSSYMTKIERLRG